MPRTTKQTQCELCGEIYAGESRWSKLRHKKKCTQRKDPIRPGPVRKHKSDAARVKYWREEAKNVRARTRQAKKEAKEKALEDAKNLPKPPRKRGERPKHKSRVGENIAEIWDLNLTTCYHYWENPLGICYDPDRVRYYARRKYINDYLLRNGWERVD